MMTDELSSKGENNFTKQLKTGLSILDQNYSDNEPYNCMVTPSTLTISLPVDAITKVFYGKSFY